jgi:hypothetical protein
MDAGWLKTVGVLYGIPDLLLLPKELAYISNHFLI